VLACCHLVVLVVLAVSLDIDWATGRDTVGNLGSTGGESWRRVLRRCLH
jgi:hypothetical protein